MKKVFLKFSQAKCEFPVNFAKSSRAPFFIEHLFPRTPPVGASEKLKAEVARSCTIKKVLLEILLNSQENTCARVSFLQSSQPAQDMFKRS